jgi:hypothetical protein
MICITIERTVDRTRFRCFYYSIFQIILSVCAGLTHSKPFQSPSDRSSNVLAEGSAAALTIRCIGLRTNYVDHSHPRSHLVFSSCLSSVSSATVLDPPAKRCSSSLSSIRVKYSPCVVGYDCFWSSCLLGLFSWVTTQYLGEYFVQLCR